MSTTSRKLLVIGSLSVVAGGILLVVLAPGGRDEVVTPVVTPEHEETGAATDPRLEIPDEAAASANEPDPLPRVEAVELHALNCLRASTREPVEGVGAYAKLEQIAGPSDPAGTLVLPETLPVTLTIWAEGWIPQEMRASTLPDEILLASADAILEVSILGLEADHRVARSLLQPRERRARQGGPWDARFKPLREDLHLAESIPPGRYDVYFWISKARGAPRSLSRSGVEVPAGEKTILSLDIADLVVPDSDE